MKIHIFTFLVVAAFFSSPVYAVTTVSDPTVAPSTIQDTRVQEVRTQTFRTDGTTPENFRANSEFDQIQNVNTNAIQDLKLQTMPASREVQNPIFRSSAELNQPAVIRTDINQVQPVVPVDVNIHSVPVDINGAPIREDVYINQDVIDPPCTGPMDVNAVDHSEFRYQ